MSTKLEGDLKNRRVWQQVARLEDPDHGPGFMVAPPKVDKFMKTYPSDNAFHLVASVQTPAQDSHVPMSTGMPHPWHCFCSVKMVLPLLACGRSLSSEVVSIHHWLSDSGFEVLVRSCLGLR